jgi:hypothetical protein
MLSTVIPFLPALVQDKGFRCVKVAPESIKGEDLVRVTFTFTPEGRNRLKGGWFVLDPRHNWVIRSSEIELDLGEKSEGVAKWTVQNEFTEGSDRHPIATKHVMRIEVWEKGRLTAETEYITDYASRERPSIPEEEFTLSAYGLPEPHWARPKKTPWYWWFGMAGIGCLCVAAAVRWLKTRKAPAGACPNDHVEFLRAAPVDLDRVRPRRPDLGGVGGLLLFRPTSQPRAASG